MDHLAVLDAQPPRLRRRAATRTQFQAWFEKATGRWLSGAHDGEYAESWPEFRDRVLAGLDALGDGTTVVVTSGGPISVVVAHLLESRAAYRRIAPVVVNASVTKVVVGRRGHTLVSFNEHGHLPGRPADLPLTASPAYVVYIPGIHTGGREERCRSGTRCWRCSSRARCTATSCAPSSSSAPARPGR